MPRYHLLLYDPSDTGADGGGFEFDDAEAAERAAIDKIRTHLAGKIEEGAFSASSRVAIVDEKGDVVRVVPFSRAIPELGGEDRPPHRPAGE